MSNLQDVPLAEPENMPTTEEGTATPKSNSLKRFFKLGKKSTSGQDFSEDVSELEDQDENNKEAARPGSIGRFLTRFKGSSKSGTVHFEESVEPTASSINTAGKDDTGKPEPSIKPTIRTSISGYWKQLFHRQKSANRLEENLKTNEEPVESQEVQQEQQLEPIQPEHGPILSAEKPSEEIKMIMPGKSMENCVPEILEEVQVLAVSDEIVDPSHEENKKED